MKIFSRLIGGPRRHKQHVPSLPFRSKSSGWGITGDEDGVDRYVRHVAVDGRAYEIHFSEEDIDEFLRTLAKHPGGRADIEAVLRTTKAEA